MGLIKDQRVLDIFFENYLYTDSYTKLLIEEIELHKSNSEYWEFENYLEYKYKGLMVFLQLMLLFYKQQQNDCSLFVTESKRKNISLHKLFHTSFEQKTSKLKHYKQKLESLVIKKKDIFRLIDIFMNFDFQSMSMHEARSFINVGEENYRFAKDEKMFKRMMSFAFDFHKFHTLLLKLINIKLKHQFPEDAEVAKETKEDYKSSESEGENHEQEDFEQKWFEKRYKEMSQKFQNQFGEVHLFKTKRERRKNILENRDVLKILEKNMKSEYSLKILRLPNHFLFIVLKQLLKFMKFRHYLIEGKFVNMTAVVDIPAVYNYVQDRDKLEFRSFMDFYKLGSISRIFFFDVLVKYFPLNFWVRLFRKSKRKYKKYREVLCKVFGIKGVMGNWNKYISSLLTKEKKIINDMIFFLQSFFSYFDQVSTRKSRNLEDLLIQEYPGFLDEKIKLDFIKEAGRIKKNYFSSNDEKAFLKSISKFSIFLIAQLETCKQNIDSFKSAVALDITPYDASIKRFPVFTLLKTNTSDMVPKATFAFRDQEFVKIRKSFKNYEREVKCEILRQLLAKYTDTILQQTLMGQMEDKEMKTVSIHCFCVKFLFRYFYEFFDEFQENIEFESRASLQKTHSFRVTRKCPICKFQHEKVEIEKVGYFISGKTDEKKEGDQVKSRLLERGFLVKANELTLTVEEHLYSAYFSIFTSIFRHSIEFDTETKKLRGFDHLDLGFYSNSFSNKG